MKPRLFNLATFLSLLMAIGTIPHWYISHYRQDAVVYTALGPGVLIQYAIETQPGAIVIDRIDIGEPGQHSIGLRRAVRHDRGWLGPLRELSFHGARDRWVGFNSYIVFYLDIPHWAILLLSMVLPSIWFIHYRRQRRQDATAHEICLNCRYDLRATPNLCPECGMIPAAKGSSI